MSEQDSGADKTEEPTPKRREDFRKEGKTASSQELASVFVLTAAGMALLGTLPSMRDAAGVYARELWGRAAAAPELYLGDSPVPLMVEATSITIQMTIVPALAMAVAGFAASAAQVGLQWSSKPLVPDIKRFDPIAGLKSKLFSPEAIAGLVKSLLKLVVVIAAAYIVFDLRAAGLSDLGRRSLSEAGAWTTGTMARLGGGVLLGMAVLAAADVGWTRYRHYEKMRMTKDEVKKEQKEEAGDPHVRARVRRIMASMSRNRMMAAVADATVIVTNPSHYAVALKYELGGGTPPIVVARGLDTKAEAIKSVARSKGIPRVENRPLARALYASCKEGSAVPPHLFDAVAEVIHFVLSLRRPRRGLGRGGASVS